MRTAEQNKAEKLNRTLDRMKSIEQQLNNTANRAKRPRIRINRVGDTVQRVKSK